jgi:hypothetical protein
LVDLGVLAPTLIWNKRFLHRQVLGSVRSERESNKKKTKKKKLRKRCIPSAFSIHTEIMQTLSNIQNLVIIGRSTGVAGVKIVDFLKEQLNYNFRLNCHRVVMRLSSRYWYKSSEG